MWMRPGIIAAAQQGPLVDGYAVGQVGATGTIYEGYTLSYAEDFADTWENLFIAPHKPHGKYMSTQDYRSGARNPGGQLAHSRDTSPYDLGQNDAARGVPGSFQNNRIENGALVIGARGATPSQRALFGDSVRYNITGSMMTTPSILFHADAAGTGDIIVDFRQKNVPGAGSNGWHTDLWTSGVDPQGVKLDKNFENSDNKFVGTVNALNPAFPTRQEPDGALFADTANFHLLTWKLNKDQDYGWIAYRDGVQYQVIHGAANYPDNTDRLMFTGHVVDSETNEATWLAMPQADLHIDYFRVWRRTGKLHFRPLIDATTIDKSVAVGATTTITIPAATTLWGMSAAAEYLICVQQEDNEPGADNANGYSTSLLPVGLTVNYGTRTISVASTLTAKPGRLHMVWYAKQAGCTVEPLHFVLNVGPKINLSIISYSPGVAGSMDIYPYADCGVLVTDGVSKTKIISFSGLPTGFSYNDSTGILSWTTAASASGTIVMTATNSIGQQATANITLSTASVPVAGEDAVTTAYVNAMSASPAQARRVLINDFIAGLRTDGLLTKLKRLSLIASHDSQAGYLDVIVPASKTLTAVAGGTFTVDRGFAGDAVAAYLRMNETVYAAGATQDSVAFGVWCNQQNGSTSLLPHVSEANATPFHAISARGGAGSDTFRCSEGGTAEALRTQGASPSRTGHRMASRTGAAIKRGYFNGTRTADLTTASAASVYEIHILKASTTYCADRVAAFYVGTGFTDTDATNMHSRLNTFLTAIGAA